MIVNCLTFSFSLVFISFIVGMIANALIVKTKFYDEKLSHLNFIRSETANTVIGVGVVKWIVKNTFFKYFNQALKFDRRMKISDIKMIRKEMTKSEISHLFAFLFVAIFVISMICKQKYFCAFIILFVNTIMNLHPSLLQQQNKRRIDKLIYKFENLKKTN